MEFKERWESLSNPIRPLKEQVESYFPTKYSAFTLILGSTPEIRDACYRRNSHVTVMDINRDNYTELTSLCTEPCGKREQFIHHDWLQYILDLENQFDLIISDVPYLYMDKQEADSFTRNVYRYVKDGGCFVFRQIYESRVMFKSLVDEVSLGKIKFTTETVSFLLMAMLCNSTNHKSLIDLSTVQSNIRFLKATFSPDLFNRISFHLSEYNNLDRPELFDSLVMPKAIYREEFIKTTLEESCFLCLKKNIPFRLGRHRLDYKLYYCRKSV